MLSIDFEDGKYILLHNDEIIFRTENYRRILREVNIILQHFDIKGKRTNQEI